MRNRFLIGGVAVVCCAFGFGLWTSADAQTLTAEKAFYRQPPPPGAGEKVDEPRNLSLYLGLKYAILKHEAGNQVRVVNENHVFRNGDVIRLRLWVNDDGYLYVANRDPSGNWSLVFPSPVFRDGNNWLMKSEEPYVIPVPPGGFEFYGEAGEEELYVVFSRTEIDFLEDKIYEPGGDKDKKEIRKDVLMASNRLDIDGVPEDLTPKGIRPVSTVEETFQDASLKQDMNGPVAYAVMESPEDDRIVQKITLIHH